MKKLGAIGTIITMTVRPDNWMVWAGMLFTCVVIYWLGGVIAEEEGPEDE